MSDGTAEEMAGQFQKQPLTHWLCFQENDNPQTGQSSQILLHYATIQVERNSQGIRTPTPRNSLQGKEIHKNSKTDKFTPKERYSQSKVHKTDKFSSKEINS